RADDFQAYDVPGKRGEEARQFLGESNGVPYIIRAAFLIRDYWIADTGGSRGNTVPLYTYADTISWTRGKHAFKGGGELRFGSNNAWNSEQIIPRVFFGQGIPVAGIDGTTIPGLTGADQTFARNLLADLAG